MMWIWILAVIFVVSQAQDPVPTAPNSESPCPILSDPLCLVSISRGPIVHFPFFQRCLRRPMRIGDTFTARGNLMPNLQRWTCDLETQFAKNVFAHMDHRLWGGPLIVYTQRPGLGAFQPENKYGAKPFLPGTTFELTVTILSPTMMRTDYGKKALWPGTTWTMQGAPTSMDAVKIFECYGDIYNVSFTGDALAGKVSTNYLSGCPPYDSYHDDDKHRDKTRGHRHSDWDSDESDSSEWPKDKRKKSDGKKTSNSNSNSGKSNGKGLTKSEMEELARLLAKNLQVDVSANQTVIQGGPAPPGPLPPLPPPPKPNDY